METPEEWPPASRRIADSEHLKAIGLFSLSFNYAEDVLRDIFIDTFPASEKYASRLFNELNNRKRIDMARELVIHGSYEERAKETILAALLQFDICTDNRNIVMHATNDIDSSSEVLRLAKRSRNNPDELNDYEIPLPLIRRVAEESGGVFIFLVEILTYLRSQKNGSPKPLPGIPPRPYRLSPSRPQEAPEAGPPRP